MVNFGLLPPEINSGRMYAGPGAGSLLNAAASWHALAIELHTTAGSYGSAVSDLGIEWQGPSSSLMAAAASPYVEWMTATAAQAEQTAAQAKAAASAYENAFLATVPPTVIAANRSQLMALVATNVIGQNTPAIAATEVLYAEMWAQDAAAMYSYAGSSATASQLPPFRPPPRTTSAATASQGSHVQTPPQLASALPRALQSLANPATTAAAPTDPLFTPAELFVTALTSFFNGTIGPLSPIKLFSPFGSFYDLAVQTFLAPFNNFNMQAAYGAALGNAAVGLPPPVSPISPLSGVGTAGPALSAEIGNAGVVGKLSVPPGWATAAPAITSVAAVSPQLGLGSVPAMVEADGQGSMLGTMALSGLAGRAVTGTGGPIAGSVGGGAGIVAAATETATIIVIPED